MVRFLNIKGGDFFSPYWISLCNWLSWFYDLLLWWLFWTRYVYWWGDSRRVAVYWLFVHIVMISNRIILGESRSRSRMTSLRNYLAFRHRLSLTRITLFFFRNKRTVIKRRWSLIGRLSDTCLLYRWRLCTAIDEFSLFLLFQINWRLGYGL